MNKPSITKAELIEWLETAVYLLDRVSLPLLNFAYDQKEELDELKNAKISDQKKIIELQENLIKEKDVKLDAVQKNRRNRNEIVLLSCAENLYRRSCSSQVSSCSQNSE